MVVMTAVGALLLIYLMYQPSPPADAEEPAPDPPEPPRHFTAEQLKASVMHDFFSF